MATCETLGALGRAWAIGILEAGEGDEVKFLLCTFVIISAVLALAFVLSLADRLSVCVAHTYRSGRIPSADQSVSQPGRGSINNSLTTSSSSTVSQI